MKETTVVRGMVMEGDRPYAGGGGGSVGRPSIVSRRLDSALIKYLTHPRPIQAGITLFEL